MLKLQSLREHGWSVVEVTHTYLARIGNESDFGKKMQLLEVKLFGDCTKNQTSQDKKKVFIGISK